MNRGHTAGRLYHFAWIIPKHWLLFALSAFYILNVAQANSKAVIVSTQDSHQIDTPHPHPTPPSPPAIRYQLSELSKYDCRICWQCIGQVGMGMWQCYCRLIFLMLPLSVPPCRLVEPFSALNKAWTVLTFVLGQWCPFGGGPLWSEAFVTSA